MRLRVSFLDRVRINPGLSLDVGEGTPDVTFDGVVEHEALSASKGGD